MATAVSGASSELPDLACGVIRPWQSAPTEFSPFPPTPTGVLRTNDSIAGVFDHHFDCLPAGGRAAVLTFARVFSLCVRRETQSAAVYGSSRWAVNHRPGSPSATDGSS